ncbi:MAG TPA: hypothetical protein VJR89_22545 [Polyangiales bacterium]|nr:hypothetical protein [Polyangiales bacterium]
MVIGVCGAFIFARTMGEGYPIELWLFWKMLKLWGWSLAFNLACLSFGQCLLWRVLRVRDLPALESAALAISTGVVGFAMFMYAAGALAWYGASFAITLIVVLIAIGARDVVALGRRLWNEFYAPEQRSLIKSVAGAAGAVCVAIIYVGVLSPDSLNYDATWSHQVIAQEYARAGRIVPFIADYNRNVPHLASMLYTWGYLLPGFRQALRWMMGLHIEFSLFLWTLVAVSAGLRAILNEDSFRRGWVFFFLFPIIFVYDSTLGGASDHVCGFFSVPIALAALRASQRFQPGYCALFAVQCAGAVLTKFQAMFLVTSAVLVLGGSWLWQLARLLRRRQELQEDERRNLRWLLWAPALIGAVAAVLFSPHAIRQYVFHKNPLYPFLQDIFKASVPTVPNASYLIATGLADATYQPQGTFFEKLLHALELFFTFSFVPHYSFTRDVPAFGSLFTLTFPCLLFVRNRRLLLTAAIASGALLVWGMVYNVDRNLQVFMPVLVCVTGALLTTLWRMGFVARLGVIPLVAVQIVWGGDALFYSQHDRLRQGMDLVRSGYEGNAKHRFADFRRTELNISKALPPDARVLLHNAHVSLGITRQVYLDIPGFQGLIHYGQQLATPRDLYDYLRGFGITHLIDVPRASPANTAQEEVLYDTFIAAYAIEIGKFDEKILYRMPDQPPPQHAEYRVAMLGVDAYEDGIYPVRAVNTIRFHPEEVRSYAKPALPMPKDPETWPDFVGQADAAIVGVRRWDELDPPLRSLLRKQYTTVRTLRHDFNVYTRTSVLADRVGQ